MKIRYHPDSIVFIQRNSDNIFVYQDTYNNFDADCISAGVANPLTENNFINYRQGYDVYYFNSDNHKIEYDSDDLEQLKSDLDSFLDDNVDSVLSANNLRVNPPKDKSQIMADVKSQMALLHTKKLANDISFQFDISSESDPENFVTIYPTEEFISYLNYSLRFFDTEPVEAVENGMPVGIVLENIDEVVSLNKTQLLKLFKETYIKFNGSKQAIVYTTQDLNLIEDTEFLEGKDIEAEYQKKLDSTLTP